MAFWPRKGKASFVIEAHRASCKTVEFQRRRRYTIHHVCTAFTFSGWKADTIRYDTIRWPGCSPRRTNRARVTRHFPPKKWTMFQEKDRNIALCERKSIPVVRVHVYLCVRDAPRVISVIGSTDDYDSYRRAHRDFPIPFLTGTLKASG